MPLIFCTKCGHRMSTKAPRCPGCGAPPYAGHALQHVGSVTTQRAFSTRSRHRPVIATLLSVLCVGLGQIYNGQPVVGVTLMVCWLYFLPSAIFVLLVVGPKTVLGQILLFGLLGFWMFSLLHAFRRASRIKRSPLPDRQRSTAAILSAVWPGTGQIYKRQVLKGITFFVLYLGAVVGAITLTYGGFFAFVLFGLLPGATPAGAQAGMRSLLAGEWLLVGVLAVWLIGVVDAVVVSNEEDQRHRSGERA